MLHRAQTNHSQLIQHESLERLSRTGKAGYYNGTDVHWHVSRDRSAPLPGLFCAAPLSSMRSILRPEKGAAPCNMAWYTIEFFHETRVSLDSWENWTGSQHVTDK